MRERREEIFRKWQAEKTNVEGKGRHRKETEKPTRKSK